MNQNRTNTALLVMLAVSGALNVLLAMKVRSLEQPALAAPRIKVGSHLEDIIGSGPSGAAFTVRFADSQVSTVLLVLRPGCQWCDANMPDWKVLIQEKGQNFRFVAVSLSPIDFGKYMEGSKLNVPGVSPSFGENPTFRGVTATPQTIIVDSDGTVRKIWLGAYTQEIKQDVETYFGTKLPVVVQPSS